MEQNKVLYPELRAELARNDLSYEDLGKIIGISANSVSQRMNGDVEFRITEIFKTLNYFNKKFEEIFR